MKQIRNNEEILQDAIIKLAAAKYVESEGKKLLEEEKLLNDSDEDELTDEDLKKFEKLCDREFKKQKRNLSGRKIWFYRAAAVVAVLLIIVNVSVVTVPAMRGWVWDFITQVNDEKTDIKSADANAEDEVERNEGLNKKYFDEEYGITYLPEGFAVGTELRSSAGITIDYSDNNGNMIFFLQKADHSTLHIDTEDMEVSEININGYTAMLSVKEDQVTICWEIDDYFIEVDSIGISEEELIKVAKSVKKV